MGPIEILVEHQLLTAARVGQAACSKEGCGWFLQFRRVEFLQELPAHVRVSHAQHQLDLLSDIGFGYMGE